jgi:hypothetical protein
VRALRSSHRLEHLACGTDGARRAPRARDTAGAAGAGDGRQQAGEGLELEAERDRQVAAARQRPLCVSSAAVVVVTGYEARKVLIAIVTLTGPPLKLESDVNPLIASTLGTIHGHARRCLEQVIQGETRDT